MPLSAGMAARASAPASGRSTPILMTGPGPPNRQELPTVKERAATNAAAGERSTCRLSRFGLAAFWQYLYSSSLRYPLIHWRASEVVGPTSARSACENRVDGAPEAAIPVRRRRGAARHRRQLGRGGHAEQIHHRQPRHGRGGAEPPGQGAL